MPFVQAKCPECGGMLAVDDSKKAANCQFCGEAFIVQEAVINNNTYNNYDNRTTHNYGDGAVVNVYEDKSKDFVIEGGVLKEYHSESVDVVVPDGVVEIDESCFKNLKIKSIFIPASVTSIGVCAFCDCTNLSSINVDENNNCYLSDDGILYSKDKSTLVQYPAGNTNIKYSTPDSVTKICDGSLCNCKNLKFVTIGENVTHFDIGRPVFGNCVNLVRVEWNAKRVHDFEKEIGYNEYQVSCLFRDTAGTESSGIEIIFGDSVEVIPSYLCYESFNLKTVSIGRNVNNISKCAFYDCKNLTSVTINSSLTDIPKYAFQKCINIKYVTLPEGVTKYKERRAKEEAERQAKIQAEQAEKQRIIAERKSNGLCQHCGGAFKGLFSSKCSSCGKPKDY